MSVGPGQTYCHHHDPARATERSRAASRAGKSKASRELLDIKRKLSDLADDVLAGRVSARDAAVVSQVRNVQLRAIELERKVKETEELEESVAELQFRLEELRRERDRMGRLRDEVEKLRLEVEALAPKTSTWNGEITDEELAYWEDLTSRWERGEDLSGENAEDVEMLDDIEPIIHHMFDENAFDGTLEEWAAYYLPPRALEARRRRIQQRSNSA